jgi:hypothetical protein
MVDADWLPLATVWQRCQSVGASSLAFEDILKSGRVPLRGKCLAQLAAEDMLTSAQVALRKRLAHLRADPLEHLLPRVGNVHITPWLNEIGFYLDSSSADQRKIGWELARSRGAGPRKTAFNPPMDWRFGEVRVHSLELTNELAAAGFDVAETSDHAGSKRRLAYKGELVSFMQQLGPKMLAVLTDDEVAGRFRARIEARKQAGQSALQLPQLRHIANQVANLRPRVLART